MKKQTDQKEKEKEKTPPREGRTDGGETYLAPPPPSKGRIIGVDCHPDTFTAAVVRGTTPHDATRLSLHADMTLGKFLEWAGREFTKDDLFLMEAGSNSFEIHRRLVDLGLRAAVMESCHVGKHAKSYADNDRMAAERIALVFLQGNAPCVWVPDPLTRERRELLHAYTKAVTAHTAASNGIKGYLNQSAIRLGKRNPALESTRAWVLGQREWTPLQREILADHFDTLAVQAARRKRLMRLIARQVAEEPRMILCMKLLGIGVVNAFALLAVIGDIRRFENPAKLVAYIGLNPGQRESGKGKKIRLGVGKRGRGDIRRLLIQGAQAVLRMGRATALGQWGWKLFARKGERNIAVAAIARKLLVQVWHALKGNEPKELAEGRSFDLKLTKLAVLLGKVLRAELGLTGTAADCIARFKDSLRPEPEKTSTA